MTRAEARILVCPMPLPDESWDANLAAAAVRQAAELDALDEQPAWKLVRARWMAQAHNLRRQLGHKHTAANHAADQGELCGYRTLMGLPEERVLEARAAQKWQREEARREEQASQQGRERAKRQPKHPRSLQEAQFRLTRRKDVLALARTPGWQQVAMHLAASAWAAYRALEWCTAEQRPYYQGIISAAGAAVNELVEDVCLGGDAEHWLATRGPKEQRTAKEAGNA
jgi:hypothetical protein